MNMEIGESKENSNLFSLNGRNSVKVDSAKCEFNRNTNDYGLEKGPPDGGVRAYFVMVGSFLTNGLLFGVINSYSVIYRVLQEQLSEKGVDNSASRASLVGALAMGTTFLLSPLSGVLTGLLGIRVTAVMGGSLAAVAMLASSFFVNNVDMLCFTYGILYGLGASLAYTPSLTILGHYFKRHLGVVNGIVTIGSSVFTVIMPPLMDYVIYTHGLDSMFHLLAVLSFGIALCGLLFKPTPLMTLNRPSREHNTFKTIFENVVNVEIWKNKKYRLWALSTPVCLFGYFVPYVHIKTFITERFSGENSNIPLQCIAAASGIGRAAFGFFADRTKVDKILLQQISFYVIGSLTIVLPFVGSFGLLVVISLAMGLFDGAFISLIGPIGFELCGSSGAAQAIGNMLGLAAIPLSVGPPVAAHLYTLHHSYTLPFVLAGITPLIGATLMFAIHFQRHDSVATSDANRQPRGKNDNVQDVEKAPVNNPLLEDHHESFKPTDNGRL